MERLAKLDSPVDVDPEFKSWPQEHARLRQTQALRLFTETGKLLKSMENAGLNPSIHYYWLKNDAWYADHFQEAKEIVADRLEDEIWRRAHDGVPVKVGWYKGKPGGIERKYSDQLAMFRMRALRPQDYRESVQVTNDTNVHITVEDARARLLAMMQRNPALIDRLKETMGDAAVKGAICTEQH